MAVSALTTDSASRLERKRARNHDALVAAARKLFVRHGFEGTTIAAIAEEADLGFGTFYRYFPDKESALREVLAEAGREVDDVLLADDDPAVRASVALTDLTRRFAAAAARNRAVFALWWQLTLRDGARARAARTDNDAPLPMKLHAALARIIDRGIASRDFTAGDAATQAGIIASAHMFLLGATATDDGQAVETLCNFELRALGAPIDAMNGRERMGT